MKIGIVVPHIFMHRQILPKVIFSPGVLAINLAEGLQELGADVTLFTPGLLDVQVANVTADLSYFDNELSGRGYGFIDLLKKHPLTFITLARQVQSELVAKAFELANRGEFDIIHIYSNEEDIALPFAQFSKVPVVFTHHDPFNFMVRYKNVFPKYAHLPWISISLAQRAGMPANTNWAGNVYHGLPESEFAPNYSPTGNYALYMGRIIQPKGVHLAIAAAKQAGLQLKIAGRHYAGHKDSYWHDQIQPKLSRDVEFVGFTGDLARKQDIIGNARVLMMPSTFNEPFGMVAIEALACGTPVVGLDSGAIPEVISDGKTGFVVAKSEDESKTVGSLAAALKNINQIDRHTCRAEFESRFTARRMCQDYLRIYRQLTEQPVEL